MTSREIISSEPVFKGKIVEVAVDRMRMPGGDVVDREVVRHPGAVAVVALGEDGSILMVRQYRHAVDNDLLEIPAGKLDGGEDPWVAVRRELEEETGYECGSLELLVSFYSAPGFSDERMHLFLATDLTESAPQSGATGQTRPTRMDGDEPISIEWLAQEEALAAVYDGRIVDAKSIVGIALLKLREHPEDLGVEL